jgi:hypothetical protein
VRRKTVKLDGYYKQPLTFNQRSLEKLVDIAHPYPPNIPDADRLEIQEKRDAELKRLIQKHKDEGTYAETEADMIYKHHVYQYHGCMYHGHLHEDCPQKFKDIDKHPLHRGKISVF